jgi:hypothetical protein
MRGFNFLAIAAVAGASLFAAAPQANAQAVTVNIGVAPSCPYGYYDYAPYNCVPNGYYGPEWFSGGVFIGAGPWFHGPADFRGSVDNHYDPQHGYNGSMPKRGDSPAVAQKAQEPRSGEGGGFQGNETRDGRGNQPVAKPPAKPADKPDVKQ